MEEIQVSYTVAEVAKILAYSTRTIIRLFADEPGVIVKRGKRRTIRIPKPVLQRVLRKLTVH